MTKEFSHTWLMAWPMVLMATPQGPTLHLGPTLHIKEATLHKGTHLNMGTLLNKVTPQQGILLLATLQPVTHLAHLIMDMLDTVDMVAWEQCLLEELQLQQLRMVLITLLMDTHTVAMVMAMAMAMAIMASSSMESMENLSMESLGSISMACLEGSSRSGSDLTLYVMIHRFMLTGVEKILLTQL